MARAPAHAADLWPAVTNHYILLLEPGTPGF